MYSNLVIPEINMGISFYTFYCTKNLCSKSLNDLPVITKVIKKPRCKLRQVHLTEVCFIPTVTCLQRAAERL